MSKLIRVIVICLMISLGGCQENKNKSIAVKKLIFSEIIGEDHVEVHGDTTIYISVLVPGTTYKIEGNKIVLFKPGDDVMPGNNSWIDSSFTGYLDEVLIEKINNGLEIIDYKNKNELDFIDSAKYKKWVDGCHFGLGFHPFIYIEFGNSIKYYWKYNPNYFNKRYINFINMLKDIEKKIKLTYIKDTNTLKLERQKITKFYADSLKLKSYIVYIPKNKAGKE